MKILVTGAAGLFMDFTPVLKLVSQGHEYMELIILTIIMILNL